MSLHRLLLLFDCVFWVNIIDQTLFVMQPHTEFCSKRALFAVAQCLVVQYIVYTEMTNAPHRL
jgi:hypothetical protein